MDYKEKIIFKIFNCCISNKYENDRQKEICEIFIDLVNNDFDLRNQSKESSILFEEDNISYNDKLLSEIKNFVFNFATSYLEEAFDLSSKKCKNCEYNMLCKNNGCGNEECIQENKMFE